jgi:hypothetical protein
LTYKQTYTIDEYIYGPQTITFVVSDKWEDLYVGEATETDIYDLDVVKEDLNTEEGSFAIDELPFAIRQSACNTVDREKAMFFALDAADYKVQRFVALFFGADRTLENIRFVGRIGNKISGDDKKWAAGTFLTAINPTREYKLSAYSFDCSLLGECKMTDKIKKPDGSLSMNIYERFTASQWDDAKTIFDNRTAFATTNIYQNIARWTFLGNLYDVIEMYLKYCEWIIWDLTGTFFGINLAESTLGIQSSPTKYEQKIATGIEIQKQEAAQTIRKELKLSPTESGEGWSSVFISRKLVDPELGNSMTEEWQRLQASAEKMFSFKAMTSVLDLLGEIARAFGCYVVINYGASEQINIEFKSKAGMLEAGYTYLFGAKDAAMDTSSVISKEADEYYAAANNLAMDAMDAIANKKITSEPEASEEYKKAAERRAYEKEKRNREFKRLVLSTSQTWLHLKTSDTLNYWYLVNLAGTGTAPTWNIINLTGGYVGDARWNDFIREYLHTGIFIKTTAPEPEQIERLGTTPVWRPASKVFTKINEADMDFNTLADYINYITARDKQYYETEYTLTVPFWNGFSKATDGTNPSWKNIKRGSKIKLAEHVRRYNGTAWIEEDVMRTYVVVGIETSLRRPETKLKLHNVERFAFGYWNGNEGTLPEYSFTPGAGGYNPEVNNEYMDYPASGEGFKGDAVMINDLGKAEKCQAISQYQSNQKGIALTDWTDGGTLTVQIGGRVELDVYNFGTIGELVFARSWPEGLNVTEQLLEEKTENEDMIVIMGRIDGAKSFVLQQRELVYE